MIAWLANLNELQTWLFALAIGISVAVGVLVLNQYPSRNKQCRQLGKSPQQSGILCPLLFLLLRCPHLKDCKCGYESSEAGLDLKTTKTKRGQTGGQKGYRGKGLK
jgi:hypothetical protein